MGDLAGVDARTLSNIGLVLGNFPHCCCCHCTLFLDLFLSHHPVCMPYQRLSIHHLNYMQQAVLRVFACWPRLAGASVGLAQG